MYRIENQEFLYAFFVILIFIAVYWRYNVWRKKSLKNLGQAELIQRMTPENSKIRRGFKFSLLLLAAVFFVLGLLNPQIGAKLEKVQRKGVDIMVALDVSNSMLAQDIRPDRLTQAKYAISKMIEEMVSDRIGLIVFAGKAYKQLPITTDYAAAKMFLETVNTNIIPTQGTNIGAAIEMAATSFNSEEKTKNKVIIVITDGEDHEQNAIVQAEEAAKNNIIVHTIGMGMPEGAPIPIVSGEKIVDYKKDSEGNTVISKLNEVNLEKIAAAGNGIYVRSTNSRNGLKRISQEIDKMQKKEFESKVFSDYQGRYYYFFAIALVLMIFELLISEKRSKWVQKINLFNEEKR